MSDALTGLNEAQAYAVSLSAGPILVIAGAGSGKTRTLTHRVAHLVEKGTEPSSILLMTFTRRAAGEMLARARELHRACGQVEGGTFHSLSFRLLKRMGGRIGLPKTFGVMDQSDASSIIKGAIDERDLKKKGDRRFPKAKTIVSMISKARNLEISLADAVDNYYSHLLFYLAAIEEAAEAYAQAKKAQHLLDYDDLLFKAEELLRDEREARDKVNGQWRTILVDEYQDTNAVQARLVKLLAGERRDVMVVGDDAQSIYGFRGARVRNILEFPQQFKGTRLVKLEQNYRSSQSILDLTNKIIEEAEEKYDKHLFSDLSGGRPKLMRPRDEREQTKQVADRIAALMDKGARPDQVAVLFRAGRDSFDLEVELTSRRVPFVKVGGIQFLEAAHIKDVLAHLRVVANPMDFTSWQRILMLLPRVGPKAAQQIIARMVAEDDPSRYHLGISEAPQARRIPQLLELARLMEELHTPEAPPLDLVENILAYYKPVCEENFEDFPRRMRDLEELPNLARTYDSLGEFMGEVVLEPPQNRAEETTGGRVTLSTVHSAKGLEWPHVFIIWAVDGRFPSSMTLMDPESLEEERRLMYVACTRAGKDLFISAPRESFSRDDGVSSLSLSRFLAGCDASLLESEHRDILSSRPGGRGPVFNVPDPDRARHQTAAPSKAAPAQAPSPARAPAGARGGGAGQDRPFATGAKVSHAKFGEGMVMGYKGNDKIFVRFARYGLKTLVLKYANLDKA